MPIAHSLVPHAGKRPGEDPLPLRAAYERRYLFACFYLIHGRFGSQYRVYDGSVAKRRFNRTDTAAATSSNIAHYRNKGAKQLRQLILTGG